MFVALHVIAQPLLRDFELRTDELFFSAPMRKGDYLWGRLAAGLASLGMFVLVGLGMMIGAAMPWIDPHRLGPFSLAPYLWAFGILIVPNLVFVAALISLLAVTTRSLLIVYLGIVALLVLWLISGLLLGDRSTRLSLADRSVRRACDRPGAVLVRDRAQHPASATEWPVAAQSRRLARDRGSDAGCSAMVFRPQRCRRASGKRQLARSAEAAAPRAIACLRQVFVLSTVQPRCDNCCINSLRYRGRTEERAVPGAARVRRTQSHRQRLGVPGSSAPASIRSPGRC